MNTQATSPTHWAIPPRQARADSCLCKSVGHHVKAEGVHLCLGGGLLDQRQLRDGAAGPG